MDDYKKLPGLCTLQGGRTTREDERMSDNMRDMVAWLREQIESDIEKAESASPGPWSYEDSAIIPYFAEEPFLMPIVGMANKDDAEHILAHSPTEVIADCEAKLELIELYELQAAKRHQDVPQEDRTEVLAAVIIRLADCYRHREHYENWEGWADLKAQ
jgi:hypothetical protein